MKISYDPGIDALYIRLIEGKTRMPHGATFRRSCPKYWEQLRS